MATKINKFAPNNWRRRRLSGNPVEDIVPTVFRCSILVRATKSENFSFGADLLAALTKLVQVHVQIALLKSVVFLVILGLLEANRFHSIGFLC